MLDFLLCLPSIKSTQKNPIPIKPKKFSFPFFSHSQSFLPLMFHQTYFNFLSRIIYFQRRKKIKLKEKTLQYQPITQRHESLSPLIKTTQNFIYKR